MESPCFGDAVVPQTLPLLMNFALLIVGVHHLDQPLDLACRELDAAGFLQVQLCFLVAALIDSLQADQL